MTNDSRQCWLEADTPTWNRFYGSLVVVLLVVFASVVVVVVVAAATAVGASVVFFGTLVSTDPCPVFRHTVLAAVFVGIAW